MTGLPTKNSLVFIKDLFSNLIFFFIIEPKSSYTTIDETYTIIIIKSYGVGGAFFFVHALFFPLVNTKTYNIDNRTKKFKRGKGIMSLHKN